ncbi:MAG: DUF1616 domain-containing protein [Dehalococcoidales bacterium]|nr:DUF1616 domain-containing protein [Dehalococcoidales bacterium]
MDFSPLLDTIIPSSGGLLIVRAIVAGILVFFLPGYVWTLVIFRKINIIERFALSIGLSMALTTLCILVLNVLLGMPITGTTGLIVIIVITVIPAGIYFFRRFMARNPEATDGD